MLRPDEPTGTATKDTNGHGLEPAADISAFANLQESPESKYDPMPRDLAPVWHLMAQLGPNFDQEFMSIQKPIEAYNFPNGSIGAKAFNFGASGLGRRIPVPNEPALPAFLR